MIHILYTVDWHIGQTLRGLSREHKNRKFLDRLKGIVVERNVDALIIAGGVFDGQKPSREAQRLSNHALVRLSRTQRRKTTEIAASNLHAAGGW